MPVLCRNTIHCNKMHFHEILSEPSICWTNASRVAMLRTVDPFTFSFFKQLTSWPMVHTVGNVYLCTASKWISFIAWISAQRKPHLWFDNSFWLTLWVQVSSHMEMGLKTRPDSPKKWCQVSDCRLRAWRSHTYHSLCLGGSGAPLGPLHANRAANHESH